jgi:hypothetical protein
MWKEYPATNKEILPTACFSVPSNKGYQRPLVMGKDADNKAGEYKCEQVYKNEIEDGDYLSEDIRRLTETFVNGVRSVNSETMTIPWLNLKNANVKYLMSYIKSYVYEQLLQDRDNRGVARSEEYLKNVLETFFSLIPDSIIEKFDKGLEAHDEIRANLEGVPEDDIVTRKSVLKSQGYFKTIDDYNLFVVLRKYILTVKNNFNHLVWVLYRSKIGLVSLKSVRAQLSAIFGFVCKGRDKYKPKNKEQILDEMCPKKLSCRIAVEGFLKKIRKHFKVENLNKSQQAALCYKFQEEINYKYLNARFYYHNDVAGEHKFLRQERFRDLCLLFWEIEEENTLKRNKCLRLMDKFGEDPNDKAVWESMKEFH